jgi:thiol-disulfide isomerase/thioredoxin
MRFRNILIAAAAASAIAFGACGGDGDDAGNPDSELTPEQAAVPLEGAPPELARLRDEANQLLPGGVDALEERLAELEGTPVVINKWASWCGPCRFEFPFFQSQATKHGDEIAFLGVDSEDPEDAAVTFLEELPVPYPSYSDPESEIAESLDADREFPATVFIDSSGEQVFVHRGGYASEDDLIADIDRYAN